MIHKILRQSDFYHNLDPLFQLIGEINESTVLVEGQMECPHIYSVVGLNHFIYM